ncbi:MAG: hypothetical protein FD180_3332 [Planctomycetota bacterium]|nr:MAG: hypothetical protein FD180_3332 [Planctomycetota bacterium]
MKGIADTGFVVAFASSDDHDHEWAVGVANGVTVPLLTCEAVLSEASFHLKNSAIVLAMVGEGLLEPSFNCLENLPHLAELAKRYADRRPDFADLCLIRMSELHRRHSVITTDQVDFRVYRRNKREAIPLICPPLK